MKALQITAPGQFEILEVPKPVPSPDEVLVKILAVTSCTHWDLHIFGGKPMFPSAPIEYPYTIGQPGHEACGEVEAIGANVTGYSTGQRVCIWRDRGHHRLGCYAQYIVVEPHSLIPAPSGQLPEACAPLELAMCVSAHILYAKKLGAITGRRAGVFGLGPAGLVAVQLLLAEGADHVIGFDPEPERRALARTFGAALTLDPASPEAAALPKRGHAGSLDITFDCVGIRSAVHQAMEITENLVVLFAVQRDPYTFQPHFWAGLTLAGTRPHTREAAEYAAARIDDGTLNLAPMVGPCLPLESYDHAIELLRNKEAFKVAFLPNG